MTQFSLKVSSDMFHLENALTKKDITQEKNKEIQSEEKVNSINKWR